MHDESRNDFPVTAPMVSIGLPVFNGENYLAETLDSILRQTYSDFELIISDNASTDRTAAICEEYQEKDFRIIYSCNETNLGAGPNYDLCFKKARGKYFKWAAHDDLIAPDFLEKTVQQMEREPDAVLCTIGIRKIGPDGETFEEIDGFMWNAGDPRPSKRFASAILERHFCTDFFGLFQREALEGSQLHGNYRSSDRVLLAEMALVGRFTKVPLPLLYNRDHPDRYMKSVMTNRRAAAQWLDTSKHGIGRFDNWLVFCKLWGLVGKRVAKRTERLACYGHLGRWLLNRNNSRAMANDVAYVLGPRLFETLQELKSRRKERQQHAQTVAKR